MTSPQGKKPEDNPGHGDGNGGHDDQGNHGDKSVTLLVNTRPHEWEEKAISLEQVVALAYPDQAAGDWVYTVSFSRGPDDKREGSLTAGHTVKVKNKMVFDVYRTSRS